MSARLPLADRTMLLRWVWRVARRNARRFAAMMALFVLATMVGLVTPQLLGMMVDAVLRGDSAPRVDALAGIFLLVLVAQALLMRAARIRSALLGERLLASSREEFVEHALRLPLGTIESAGTGDLLSRSTTDVDRLDESVRNAVPEITTALITLVLTAVAMVVTSPLLACGMVVSVPLIVLSSRWYFARSGPTLERLLHRWSTIQSSLHESVRGARTIDSLRLADRRNRHNERVLGEAAATERRHRALLTVWLPCLELGYVLPIAVLLLIGAWAYGAGLAGLGTITTMLLYAQAISNPVTELLAWAEDLQVGTAALRRILGVSRVPAERDTGGPLSVSRETDAQPERAGGVAVRDVHFSYEPGREVLHGIGLDVPAGDRLVIVGPSGAGKSTLGRLIAGVGVPDRGTVEIGGRDITSLSTERLRRQVVLLTQEQHVFSCTLRENLTLPADADDAILHELLDAVGAREWLRRLPEGLDTVLGTGAQPVPAAVAQQLALARILLADPPTLVLDEATSLLDNATSRALERSLSTLLAGRTVIAIAHRPDAARTADRVAVLDEGHIVELGDHASLLASGGSYARLHRAGLSSTGPAASAARLPEDPGHSRSGH